MGFFPEEVLKLCGLRDCVQYISKPMPDTFSWEEFYIYIKVCASTKPVLESIPSSALKTFFVQYIMRAKGLKLREEHVKYYVYIIFMCKFNRLQYFKNGTVKEIYKRF